KVELPVVERHELLNTYALANFSPGDLELFVTRRYIDEQTRTALQHLLDLKARINQLDGRLQAINAELAGIGEDQKRLRDNSAGEQRYHCAALMLLRLFTLACLIVPVPQQLVRPASNDGAYEGNISIELDAVGSGR